MAFKGTTAILGEEIWLWLDEVSLRGKNRAIDLRKIRFQTPGLFRVAGNILEVRL